MHNRATLLRVFPLIHQMSSKKILLSAALIFFFISGGLSQTTDPELKLLQRLDSIRQCPSISKHFAELYYNTTVVAFNFFAQSGENVRLFMRRLELRFGDYFFAAAQSYESEKKVQGIWATYYSDTSLSHLQYFLLGANAHINGDIWKALTTEFSLQEIKDNRKEYFHFYKGLLKIYSDVYQTAYVSNDKIRLLHHVSFGLDKAYGKLMLKHWRRRQMQLATFYFTNKTRFEKKARKLGSQMDHLNRMINKKL